MLKYLFFGLWPFFRCLAFSKRGAVLLLAFMQILLNSFALFAQDSQTQIIKQGSWTKVHFATQGQWALIQNPLQQQIQFQLGQDFSTTNGPDLYVIFSPQKASSLNDKNAMKGAIKIGRLKRKAFWGKLKGPITLKVPANVDLTKYKSVAIHCVKYSELWSVSPL